MPILQLENISKSFSEFEEKKVDDLPYKNDVLRDLKVLKNINLSVEEGEKVAIIGASGSGKTTLLYIAGLLDNPDNGNVILMGKKCSKLSDEEKSEIRRKKMGFIHQFHYLLQDCSVFENIVMPIMIDGRIRYHKSDYALVHQFHYPLQDCSVFENTVMPAMIDREIVDRGTVDRDIIDEGMADKEIVSKEMADKKTRYQKSGYTKSAYKTKSDIYEYAKYLLEYLGLSKYINTPISHLSGGEKQRIAVIRSTINKPALILADEPTGNLDDYNTNIVIQLLFELVKEIKSSIILVTHDKNVAKKCDRVMKLEYGELLDA